MPEGYEKLRDALKRKGKSDSEAKGMAAAIWNKHHKGDPVTNKPHKKEMAAPAGGPLFPSGVPMFNLDEHGRNGYEGCVLLGIPSNDYAAAEARLQKRLAELLKKGSATGESAFKIAKNKSAGIGDAASDDVISKIRSQQRTPLPAPIPTHPTAPNPNPNAPSVTAQSAGVDLKSILEQFKKKYGPRTPLG